MSNVHPQQGPRNIGENTAPLLFTVWKKALLFRGTGFTVFDSSGNLSLRVEDYTPTIKHQLLLMDASGNPIFLLRRKVMSLHHRWEGFFLYNEGNGGGSEKLRLFTINRSSIMSATTSVDVFLSSSYTKCLRGQCDYHIEGSFRKRTCAIYNRSRIMVAQVRRKESCEMLMEKDVFSVEIYRGFDPALIISWIVVVDHINSEDLRVVKSAAHHWIFRSYKFLKMADKKRKGICITNGVHVMEASSQNKTFQHQATDESIINS
ncbi:hypothetical protein SUGI_0218800 [Cryptomeria japonica]|nr:hypothetical protein SUGI_0218800 [Cryptomeria japonica]